MTDYATFPEADWKTLRYKKEELLRGASTRALDHVKRIVAFQQSEPHKIYLELWRVLQAEDDMIARMFNDMRRSNARLKLYEMVRNNLLTPEELEAFTSETRNRIIEIVGANQAMQPTGRAGG
jgi:DNA-directed RNA polymerase subunit F